MPSKFASQKRVLATLLALAGLYIIHYGDQNSNHNHQVYCSPQVFSNLAKSFGGLSQSPGQSSSSGMEGTKKAKALNRTQRIRRASIAVGASASEQLDGNHEIEEEEATSGDTFSLRHHLRSQQAQRTSAAAASGDTEQSVRDSEPTFEGSADSSSELELPAAASSQLQLQIDNAQLVNTNQLVGPSKLRIVRLLAPEATQNGTQNVTIDCMFKFDKKLDQRLTIKWFFNDELEPIYQWIPELNKRVYSDKYERFLDKSYEVSEDVDFMLQAYKWLLAAGNSDHHYQLQHQPPVANPSGAAIIGDSSNQEDSPEDWAQIEASRRLLAGRLNKLAKLGGRHSRQLLDSLRAALYMDQPEWSRFRALRLLRPTTELNGRFTCSVSSLDGDDLRSTKLVVYEPAKSFVFNVSRVSGQHYNLTCQAGQVFPQPALTLYRYRAGPLEQQQPMQQQQQLRQYAHRPKLAATLLRQEPIPGTQTQLTIHQYQQQQQQQGLAESNDITPVDSLLISSELMDNAQSPLARDQQQQQPAAYDISSWAQIDEATLSNLVVSQFECLLSIEGTNYEQRQSLALQRGWHVNSATSLASRSTLVGLFSALASLLCLMLALVSSMLIFRLLRRHAKNRVHQGKSGNNSGRRNSHSNNISDDASNSTGVTHISAPLESQQQRQQQSYRTNSGLTLATTTTTTASPTTIAPSPSQQSNISSVQSLTQARLGLPLPTVQQQQLPHSYHRPPPIVNGNSYDACQSDGVYRVPEPVSAFGGTRYVIGPGFRQFPHQQQHQQQQHFYGVPNTNSSNGRFRPPS